MYLKNFDLYKCFFDIETKKEVSGITSGIIGWYKKTNSTILGLFVENNSLYFYKDDSKYFVKDSFFVKINDLEGSQKIVNLYSEVNLILSFVYEYAKNVSIAPFEYIDDDDSDWGEFVCNIINNLDRKNNFIEYFSKNN